MPFYEYRCNHCDKISEILIGVSYGSEMLVCKYCGSNDLMQILSVSSFTVTDSGMVPGATCCGREERCNTPSCETRGVCRKDQ